MIDTQPVDAERRPQHGARVWTGGRDTLAARLAKVRLDRAPSSYAPVRAMVGRALRNQPRQLRAERVRRLRRLDLGCGLNLHDDLITLDYAWTPGLDLCWDVARGLPFADGALEGVFSEHCLEHMPLPSAASLLRECRRVLAPGGRLRLVVPDARIYLETYVRRLAGEAVAFPYEGAFDFEGLSTPMMDVNRIFYQDRDSLAGHRFMYDVDLLERLLKHVGFTRVEPRSFGCGDDPVLVKDTPFRAVESLYVEAS